MNKKLQLIAILALVVSATGCSALTKYNYSDPQKPRYISALLKIPAAPLVVAKTTFKVVTYNIKHALKVDRAIEILEQKQELNDADIVCLQEMDLDGIKMMAGEMKYNYVYYPTIHHPKTEKDFGNAILSRWPIIKDEKMLFPIIYDSQMQRIAISATVRLHDNNVMVSCLHKEVVMSAQERRQQTQMILESMPKDVDYFIVAGDFNTYTKKSEDAIEDEFVHADFKDATAEIPWTYKHWYFFNKKSKLDYIFAKNLDVVRSGKVEDRSASDHVPVWAEFAFSERKVTVK